VGKEGRLSQRLSLGDVDGFWRESVDSVNELIDDLVHPTSETARVIGAVAQGDLSQTMALKIDDRPLQGEFLQTARTINKMVDQLSSFASEVTRVAREVGTEGKLGGQAQVKGVAGTWKDLTESVNSMASNLTSQVRNIADVTKAVAAHGRGKCQLPPGIPGACWRRAGSVARLSRDAPQRGQAGRAWSSPSSDLRSEGDLGLGVQQEMDLAGQPIE
jgi:HAMP domain-containing protein